MCLEAEYFHKVSVTNCISGTYIALPETFFPFTLIQAKKRMRPAFVTKQTNTQYCFGWNVPLCFVNRPTARKWGQYWSCNWTILDLLPFCNTKGTCFPDMRKVLAANEMYKRNDFFWSISFCLCSRKTHRKRVPAYPWRVSVARHLGLESFLVILKRYLFFLLPCLFVVVRVFLSFF